MIVTAERPQSEATTYFDWLAERYRPAKRTSTAKAVGIPALLAKGDLPEVDVSLMPSDISEFVTTGLYGGDRSKALLQVAYELRDQGLTAAERLSWMATNGCCMKVALDHRRQDHGRALEFLWKQYAGKVENRESAADGFADLMAATYKGEPNLDPLRPITAEELSTARTNPGALVQHLIYRCVRGRIAAGGVGKTTLALYEAATLALGRDLWGHATPGPVKTAIVTREDDRELLVGRLGEVLNAAMLTDAERSDVLERLRILDLSAKPFRLCTIENDMVTPDQIALDWLVGVLQDFAPDWVIFDPMVSFGVGEARVNDAEQGLIDAARIIKARLGCCVEYIHHSGKANARDKALDQYAGRGGSALPDGSRMVAVLQPLDAAEWLKETGSPLLPDESGLVMALPKLSYAPPQSPIYIRRRGYAFHHQRATPTNPAESAERRIDALWQFMCEEYDAARRHTGNTLEACTEALGMSRQQVRDAVATLKTRGRIVMSGRPTAPGAHFMPVRLAEYGGDSPNEINLFEEN